MAELTDAEKKALADAEAAKAATAAAAAVQKATDKPDFRDDYFRAKSERDNLEKQVTTLTTEKNDLTKKVESNQSSSVELLRLKKAYEAGVPSHLLKLVTETTEEKIVEQIKAIMDELVAKPGNGDPDKKAKPDPNQKPAGQGDQKLGADGKPLPASSDKTDWVAKYSKASPAERVQLVRDKPADLFADVGKGT